MEREQIDLLCIDLLCSTFEEPQDAVPQSIKEFLNTSLFPMRSLSTYFQSGQ